jgi:predicted ATPase
MDDVSLIERYAQHPGVTCRAFCAMVLWLFGAYDEAAALLREALDLARRLEHPYTLTFALFVDSWLAIYREDVPHARRRADETFALSTERGFPMFTALSTIARGWARAEQGEPEAGTAEVERGLAALQATGAGMLRPFVLGLLAQANRRAGRLDDALTVIAQAIAASEATDERFYEAELHRLKGEVLLAMSPARAAEAEAALSRAVAVARSQQALSFQRRAEAGLLARASATLNDRPTR